MKNSPLIIAIAAAALFSAARAESEKAAAYVLKNRSAFNTDRNARIPFWPIGFARPAAGAEPTPAATVVAKVRLEADHFSVTSVLLGNPPLATINGRSFGEGELLPVVSGTERLRVVVRAIRDGGVILEHDGQMITVPMRRAELGAKQVQRQAEPNEFVIQVGAAAKK